MHYQPADSVGGSDLITGCSSSYLASSFQHAGNIIKHVESPVVLGHNCMQGIGNESCRIDAGTCGKDC